MKAYLQKLLAGQDLSAKESEAMLENFCSDDVQPAMAGAVLTALRMKGESMTELLGMARFLRRNCIHIDCGTKPCIDIVGTGGDGGISFNVSPTSSFVAA